MAIVRITVEIDGNNALGVTTVVPTNASDLESRDIVDSPSAIDAGSPKAGLPSDAPSDTAIGGQAVDGGGAPPFATAWLETKEASGTGDSAEEVIDAGHAPDLD